MYGNSRKERKEESDGRLHAQRRRSESVYLVHKQSHQDCPVCKREWERMVHRDTATQ